MTGPVGAAVGAAVGAVAGRLTARPARADPVAEDAYWRDNYAGRDSVWVTYVSRCWSYLRRGVTHLHCRATGSVLRCTIAWWAGLWRVTYAGAAPSLSVR
jgi:hypothetical protein